MFCKICYDMNKHATEYTSHSVKKDGKVTCPVLLKIECVYCKNSGHTYSYCPNFRTPPKKISLKTPQRPQKPLQKSLPKKNVFSVLHDESSDDEEKHCDYEEKHCDDEENHSDDLLDKPTLLRTTNSHEIKPKWKMGFSWADEMA